MGRPRRHPDRGLRHLRPCRTYRSAGAAREPYRCKRTVLPFLRMDFEMTTFTPSAWNLIGHAVVVSRSITLFWALRPALRRRTPLSSISTMGLRERGGDCGLAPGEVRGGSRGLHWLGMMQARLFVRRVRCMPSATQANVSTLRMNFQTVSLSERTETQKTLNW
jgi:hypothetical protein